METMIPLGSVLGWIFAVLGLLALIICFACLLAEADLSDDDSKRFEWTFVAALAALIIGVIFVVKYWGGGA